MTKETCVGGENMKGYRRMLFIGLFLMVILMGCAKEKTDVEIEATIGYDGTIKISNGNPLEVSVQNFGKDIEGYIRTYYDVNNTEKVEMDKEVQIAGNTTKVFQLYIPVYLIQKTFDVELVVGNEVVASTTVKPSRTIAPYQSTMGVLSDYPDDYRYLNQLQWMIPSGVQRDQDNFRNNYYQSTVEETTVSNDENNIEAVYLDEVNVLKDGSGLDFFNAIMIGQTNQLQDQEEASEAIYEWVNHGGILFVERDVKLPSRLQTVEWGEEESTKAEEDNSYNFSGEVSYRLPKESDALNQPVYVAGIPVAYDTPIGAGHIIRYAVDMKEPPISDWNRNGYFLESTIDALQLSNSQDYYFEGNSNWYDLQNLPAEKRPPFGIMGIILFIYIIAVGPLSYFILKRKDKREWMWVTIPTISIVSILLMYVIGFSSRYDRPIENAITYIRQPMDTNYMDIRSDIGIFNNKQGDVILDWNRNEEIQMMIEDNSYYNNENQTEKKKVIGRLVDGERNRYIQSGVGVWSQVRMTASKAVPIDHTGNREARLKIVDGDIEFEVTNRLPFDMHYAILFWNNNVYPIGNFEQDATVMTKGQKNIDDYFRDDVFKGTMYSNTLPDMSFKEGYEAYFANDEIADWYYNQQYYGMNQERAVVIGVNDNPIGYDLRANGEEPEIFNRNMIMIEYGVDFGETQNIGAMEFGTIQPTVESATGYMNYREMQMEERLPIYEAESGIYEFTYKMFNDYQINDIALKAYPVVVDQDYFNNNQQFLDQNGMESTLAIYNPISEEWEVLSEDLKNEVFDIDPATYVTQEGELRFQLVIPNSEQWNGYIVGLPQIGLNMGGMEND